jgi:hypothetical protein
MFPKYGKQIVVRSEWFNLAQYTSLTDLAFRLWLRINSLADKLGRVDMDPKELAYRIQKPHVDMAPVIEELQAWKHIRTYEHEGHPYAVIEGYTTEAHINRQKADKKNEAHWLNPSPPWEPQEETTDGTDEAGKGATEEASRQPVRRDEASHVGKAVKKVRNAALKRGTNVSTEEVDNTGQEDARPASVQPHSGDRTQPGPRRRAMRLPAAPLEGIHQAGQGNTAVALQKPAKAQKRINPGTTARRTTKTAQRPNERAGGVKAGIGGTALTDKLVQLRDDNKRRQEESQHQEQAHFKKYNSHEWMYDMTKKHAQECWVYGCISTDELDLVEGR